MPECNNCGGFVTEQYVRVFAPEGMDTVRVCPKCPNMVRNNGEFVKLSRHEATDDTDQDTLGTSNRSDGPVWTVGYSRKLISASASGVAPCSTACSADP
jgi:hypothetical protein